jgi:hypothetical protein
VHTAVVMIKESKAFNKLGDWQVQLPDMSNRLLHDDKHESSGTTMV